MKKFLVIDSDRALLGELARWLEGQGCELLESPDTAQAMTLALEQKPPVILCNLLSPHSNALQFCRDLRRQADLKTGAPIIIAMGNGTLTDKVNALEAGADEYMVKPISIHNLGDALHRLGALSRPMPPFEGASNGHDEVGARLKFWGVRGSIPSPGADTVFYGGNTSCVEVRVGSEVIILDAGSGLRRLGLSLMEEFRKRPMRLNLIITHTHWDHIQGFPFFLPAYDPKNQLTIYGFEGASQGLANTLTEQMESPYFPIGFKQMPSHIAIQELREMEFKINDVTVQAHFLNHPGSCAGYRLFTPGGSISYLPDIELYHRLRHRWNVDTDQIPSEEREEAPAEDRDVIEFIRDSDVLILDSQYDANEYENHVGWGHSCVEDSVAFALHANVKRLFLFHHDPDHKDEQISRMVARARQMAERRHSDLIIEAAREGFELALTRKEAVKA